jgi:hypothetical protein
LAAIIKFPYIHTIRIPAASLWRSSPYLLFTIQPNSFFMKKMLTGALCATLFLACSAPKTEDNAATEVKPAEAAAAPATSPTGASFADAKYAQMGKDGLAKFAAEDMDGFFANYADNAVWLWNNGDSIAGKAAIVDYWKGRFDKDIDSIAFRNDVWLAVNVTKPQGVEQTGIWLMSWYMVDAKYKTGKRMRQWIHTDMHYDANDKIDRVIQYLDRVPIAAAMKK